VAEENSAPLAAAALAAPSAKIKKVSAAKPVAKTKAKPAPKVAALGKKAGKRA
jgi:hypothetical protein